MEENISLIISSLVSLLCGLMTMVGHIYHGKGGESGYGSAEEVVDKDTDKKQRIFQYRHVRLLLGMLFLISILITIFLFAQKWFTKPPVDETEAFTWYLEQVQSENGKYPQNMNALGECYLQGKGTAANYERAFDCFDQAAERGSKEAIYNLAVCYSYGYGTEIDNSKAFEYFQQVEDDIADAKAFAGYYYYRGWGNLTIDKDKALEMMRISENRDSVIALYFQAIYYLFETEIEDHYSIAADFCQRAIDSGYPAAYGPLGLCYYEENSPLFDLGKAYEFFQLGAECENDFALYGLGECYRNGYIVVKDEKKALNYYQQASAQGNTKADYRLASCYFYGNATEQNDDEAFAYYFRAAERGEAEAMSMLGYCYENGIGCDKNLRAAFTWYESASQRGSSTGSYNLAVFYYFGTGTNRNYEKAVPLFRYAAEKGKREAQYYLGLCYQYGDGTEKILNRHKNGMKKQQNKGMLRHRIA